MSDLKLNIDKSVLLGTGLLRNTNITYYQKKKFNWTSNNAKTLGMTFTTDIKQNIALNLEPKLLNFENCLK